MVLFASKYSMPALIILAAILAAVPAQAHHGGGVEYFMDRTAGPITGTVTLFSFSFPIHTSSLT